MADGSVETSFFPTGSQMKANFPNFAGGSNPDHAHAFSGLIPDSGALFEAFDPFL